MAFLPWENITIKTKMNKQEILNFLNRNVEPKGLMWDPFLRKYDYGKPYHGIINDNEFIIARVSVDFLKLNPIVPFIKGKIYETDDNSIINIRIRMSITVIIIMLLFLGSLFINFIITILEIILILLAGKYFFDVLLQLFLIILISTLIYVIITGLTRYEINMFKRDFKDLFRNNIDNSKIRHNGT